MAVLLKINKFALCGGQAFGNPLVSAANNISRVALNYYQEMS